MDNEYELLERIAVELYRDRPIAKEIPMKWICEVCGHEHEGDEAPEVCPVCGALQESFNQDSKMLLNE